MPDYDDTDGTLDPRSVIISRFQTWWNEDEIITLLNNSEITHPAFFANIKQMEKRGKIHLDHEQLATSLYEQVEGDKFLHAKQTNQCNFTFFTEVWYAAVKENPSLKDELNFFLKEHPILSWYFNKEREDGDYVGEINYNDKKQMKKIFDESFFKQTATVNSPKFLLKLCELFNLPDVCAQKLPKEKGASTIDVEPVGTLNPLYDYQRDVARQIEGMLTHYSADTSRAIVALPTGAGKTRIVVESIINWIYSGKPGQEDKKFIVWMVDRKELCQQAYDTFKSIYQAIGKQDTTLRLNVFWGTKDKNLHETLKNEDYEQNIEATKSVRTSIIITTVPSLNSIINRQSDNDKDNDIRSLGEKLALVIVDEAHKTEAPTYQNALRELGFDFRRTTEPHLGHARLLGLTATPFRNEKAEANIIHENDEKKVDSRTKQLQSRFGNNFFWPDIENSSLTKTENYPQAILEVQKSATLGNDVKISAEKSFDQDGKITDYYWQIRYKPRAFERTQDAFRYDSGRDCFGLDDDPPENFALWKNPEKWQKYFQKKKDELISINREEKFLWIDEKIFSKSGEYQVYLWVKDDDGLISQNLVMRTIEINQPIKKSITDAQEKMQRIERELINDGVLSKRKRWRIDHDSEKYVRSLGRKIEFKKLSRKTKDDDGNIVYKLTETSEITEEFKELISQDTNFNEKIIASIDKLIKEEKKESILIFTNTVAHAKLLTTLLRASLKGPDGNSLNAQYIHAGTHVEERCRWISDFRKKKIHVLCNVDILTTGFDAPEVDSIVVARNPESYPLWVQMVGRGYRGPKNGGTTECRVVDFSIKLRQENEQLTDEEMLMAFRFHEGLFEEDILLTDYDLGLITDNSMKWNNEKELMIYTEWKKDGILLNRDIRIMYELFISRPEFQKWKPEFWKWLQENSKIETEPEVFEDSAITIIDDEIPAESNFEMQSKTFTELLEFIEKNLENRKLKANYQPVMLKALLESNHREGNIVYERPISRYQFAVQLMTANKDIQKDVAYFKSVPVYNVLANHGIAILKIQRDSNDDLFELNVIPLDNYQYEVLIEKLDKIISQQIRYKAAEKAAETKRKRELDRMVEHRCPKCKKIFVRYHDPPTSEENHEIIEKFGWRGNLIQSYCRRCRNGKHSENKK